MDLGRNGRVSRAEFDRFCVDHDLTDHELATHLFNLFDANADRSVSFDEYVLGVTVISARDPAARAHLLLKAADGNGDGVLDEAELTRSLLALVKMGMGGARTPAAEKTAAKKAAALAALVFAEADVNHDGKLSNDEVRGRLLTFSTIFDLLFYPSSVDSLRRRDGSYRNRKRSQPFPFPHEVLAWLAQRSHAADLVLRLLDQLSGLPAPAQTPGGYGIKKGGWWNREA